MVRDNVILESGRTDLALYFASVAGRAAPVRPPVAPFAGYPIDVDAIRLPTPPSTAIAAATNRGG